MIELFSKIDKQYLNEDSFESHHSEESDILYDQFDE